MAAGVTAPVLLLAFVLRPEMPQGVVAVAVAVAVALAVKDIAVPLMPADPEGAAQGCAAFFYGTGCPVEKSLHQ